MRAPIALLCTAACAIIAYPSTASAITIHRHVTTYSTAYVPDAQGYRDRVRIPHEKVIVYDVAPSDSDDDGCPDSADNYNGPGCNAPAPVAQPVSEPIAPTPTTTSVASAPVSTSSGCVGMEAESGSAGYSAVSPTGYIGCYQISPDHFAPGGSCAGDGTDPAGQDACAATICATEGPGAWTNPAGENPCGRLGG